MNDPERVRRGDRVASLEHVVDRDLHGERSVRFEDGVQVAPFEVLHHDVRGPVLELPRVEDADDVIAPDLDRRLRFADEPRDSLRLRPRRLREEEFHGDPLVEVHVHRRDDDPHPPYAEHPLDAVLPREHVPRSRDPRDALRRGGRARRRRIFALRVRRGARDRRASVSVGGRESGHGDGDSGRMKPRTPSTAQARTCSRGKH